MWDNEWIVYIVTTTGRVTEYWTDWRRSGARAVLRDLKTLPQFKEGWCKGFILGRKVSRPWIVMGN